MTEKWRHIKKCLLVGILEMEINAIVTEGYNDKSYGPGWTVYPHARPGYICSADDLPQEIIDLILKAHNEAGIE